MVIIYKKDMIEDINRIKNIVLEQIKHGNYIGRTLTNGVECLLRFCDLSYDSHIFCDIHNMNIVQYDFKNYFDYRKCYNEIILNNKAMRRKDTLMVCVFSVNGEIDYGQLSKYLSEDVICLKREYDFSATSDDAFVKVNKQTRSCNIKYFLKLVEKFTKSNIDSVIFGAYIEFQSDDKKKRTEELKELKLLKCKYQEIVNSLSNDEKKEVELFFKLQIDYFFDYLKGSIDYFDIENEIFSEAIRNYDKNNECLVCTNLIGIYE